MQKLASRSTARSISWPTASKIFINQIQSPRSLGVAYKSTSVRGGKKKKNKVTTYTCNLWRKKKKKEKEKEKRELRAGFKRSYFVTVFHYQTGEKEEKKEKKRRKEKDSTCNDHVRSTQL